MKKILFLITFLFSCTHYFTQTKTTETEVNFTEKAQFPNGENPFSKEFMNMVYAYVDITGYAVNGKFTFTIDEKGKMTNLQISPKVRNTTRYELCNEAD